MIMQDLPRKLLQETIKNPYKGTGITGGSNKIGPVKL